MGNVERDAHAPRLLSSSGGRKLSLGWCRIWGTSWQLQSSAVLEFPTDRINQVAMIFEGNKGSYRMESG